MPENSVCTSTSSEYVRICTKSVLYRLQIELGTYPEPVQAMLQKLLAATSPSAPVPMHWRYSLMSLAVFLFIMPPVDAGSAKVRTAFASVAEPGVVSCPG